LKRHRLIHIGASFSFEDEDAYIAIRPTILGIISEDALAAALEAEGELEEEPQEQSMFLTEQDMKDEADNAQEIIERVAE
jgi:hypothetical protein